VWLVLVSNGHTGQLTRHDLGLEETVVDQENQQSPPSRDGVAQVRLTILATCSWVVVEAMSRAPTEFYPVGQLSEDDVVAVLEATVSPTTDGSCDTVNAEACFRDREEAMRAPNAVSSTAHVTRSSLLPVTGNGCGSATSGKVAATVSGIVVAGVCGTIRIARCVIRPAPSR
jgi:hypothetical protein